MNKRHWTRRRPDRLAALALPALLCAGAAVAADWEITPSVEAAEIYRSNVTLAPDGAEQHEWITELAPGISALLDGVNNDIRFDYRAQGLFFKEDSDRNDVFHQLDAEGNFQVLPERLFLDAEARYDQQTIDPTGRVALGNTFDTGNRTDVGVYRITPWLQQPLGGFADAVVRYSFGHVNYTDTDSTSLRVQDSDQQLGDITLASTEGGRRVSWKAYYGYQRTEFDDAPEFEYERAMGQVGLLVGTRTTFLVSGGRESDVQENPTEAGLDETFWNVGFLWEPTSLQSLEARVGDRYYGTSYELHWKRRGSRGELSVDYTEDPVTANGVQFDDTVIVPGTRPIGLPELRPDVFLRKRLAGTFTYEFVRSDFRAMIYRDDREYEVSGEEDEFFGVDLDLTWRLMPRTELVFGVRYESQDQESPDVENDLSAFSAGIRRELTPKISAVLEGTHYSRDSTGGFDYEDNSGVLRVEASF